MTITPLPIRPVDENDPTPWMMQAACQGCDPDLWFPERGENGRQAKLVCSICPVRPQCLDFAIATSQRYGVWGGLTEKERRAEARARRRRA